MSAAVKRQIPNAVTELRMALCAVLIALPAGSTALFAAYALCGASDMADGFLARRLSAESAFGSRLDSAADAIFAAVCAVKFLPLMQLPWAVWALAAATAAIKIAAAFAGKVKGGALFEHSAANKAVGLITFLLLPLYSWEHFGFCAGAACAFALLIAAYEFIHNVKSQ